MGTFLLGANTTDFFCSNASRRKYSRTMRGTDRTCHEAGSSDRVETLRGLRMLSNERPPSCANAAADLPAGCAIAGRAGSQFCRVAPQALLSLSQLSPFTSLFCNIRFYIAIYRMPGQYVNRSY